MGMMHRKCGDHWMKMKFDALGRCRVACISSWILPLDISKEHTVRQWYGLSLSPCMSVSSLRKKIYSANGEKHFFIPISLSSIAERIRLPCVE